MISALLHGITLSVQYGVMAELASQFIIILQMVISFATGLKRISMQMTICFNVSIIGLKATFSKVLNLAFTLAPS